MLLHHSKTLRRQHLRARRGIVNVWVALTGMVLFAMIGLACDTAYVNLVGQQLQNAADAAALAGAEQFLKKNSSDVAMAAASATAAQNFAAGATVLLAGNPGNAPGGDIVVGTYTRSTKTFTPTTTDPNAVQVVARRTSGSPGGNITLFFAPMFGVKTSDISRSATAMLRIVYPAILVLDPHGNDAMSLNGNPQIEVTQTGAYPGAVVVNSDAADALTLNTNSTINASEIDISGGMDIVKPPTFNTPVYTGQSPVADPLAALPPPPIDSNTQPANGYVGSDGKRHFAPGHYRSIMFDNNAAATNILDPGIFVFDTDVDVKGSTNITGNGVMLYMNTGYLTLGGNGTIVLTPPTSGTYKDISIFQARTNTGTVTVNGTPTMDLKGTIYIPNGTLSTGGTPATIGNQLIVYRLSINGTANLNVNYDGRNPAPGRIFLVK